MALRLLAAAAAAGAFAGAAAQPVDSRITRVQVFPGSATVERSARIAAGERSVTFACLPAALDAQSVQAQGDATLRIGDVSIRREPRAEARCGNDALDARIRVLEERKDALEAEHEALGIATGYLKTVGGPEPAPSARRGAADAATIAATADALRRSAVEALLRQRQLARMQSDLERDLAPLLAERQRLRGAGDAVVHVTVTLAASAAAELRLSYRVAGPTWSPAYRAALDSGAGRVRIERQALVVQQTGEDWRGVALRLATGQPRRDPALPLPEPWRIGIAPTVPNEMPERKRFALAAAPAAAPAPAVEAEAFDVAIVDQRYATEFVVPQPVDVPSSGTRVALVLGEHAAPAALSVRATPRLDASAFLVAEIATPPGIWPAGALQLYRDGAYVGSSRWDATATPMVLPFGRDEAVTVRVEPERDNQGSAGFAGGRVERRLQRAYVVENRHREPIELRVFEAAPVAADDAVRVQTQFQPVPAERDWMQRPGVAMWTLRLAAGESTRVAADYTISRPKDTTLSESGH
jgi:uncharacterized protein (TIGR02231 family)